MTAGQFVASVLSGLVAVILPLVLFVAAVAAIVYLARRWNDRARKRPR